MNCWMKKRCGGSKDRRYNGLERETEILNTFTIVPRKEERRTLSMVYGMRKDFGAATRKVLQPQPLHILKTYIQPPIQPVLMKLQT